MFRSIRKIRKKRRGFSLVEMMVVVVIMGVLAGGFMMNQGRTAEKAKFKKAEADLDTLVTAMGLAYESNGSFGTVSSNTAASAFSGTYKTELEKNLRRPLADVLDPWGNEYRVSSTYVANTGAGKIEVYVGEGNSSTVKQNIHSGNKAMKRQVYNGG